MTEGSLSNCRSGELNNYAGANPPETPTDFAGRNHIIDVLRLTAGRIARRKGAAALLGIKGITLTSRRKKLGIDLRRVF